MNAQKTSEPAIDSLSELKNAAQYGGLYLVDYKSISIQGKLLDHLKTMLKDDLEDQSQHQEFLMLPDVEALDHNLCPLLDSTLESKAAEVFQCGCAYVSAFKGSFCSRQTVLKILSALGKKFPGVKNSFGQLDSIHSAFFGPTVGGFLKEHSKRVELLSSQFPEVYRLFVHHLTESICYSTRKLFNFYCNPYIYRYIMDYLAEEDSPQRVCEFWIQRLEDDLVFVQLRSDNQSQQVLASKALKLLEACNRLEEFAQGSASLIAEIRTAGHFIKELCSDDDSVKFLEEDNNPSNKGEKKNCDLMIDRKSLQVVDLVEVKNKMPRHGVAPGYMSELDNFFYNFDISISAYLSYIDNRKGESIKLNKCYPQFFMYEGSSYGIALPMVQNIVEKIKTSEGGKQDPVSKWSSEAKAEYLLRELFMEPLVLDTSPVPIATEEVRKSEMEGIITELFQKGWLRKTIDKAVTQMRATHQKQMQNGIHVRKLYVALVISLSSRVIQNPYSHTDFDGKSYADKELQQIFKPIYDEYKAQGYHLELFLI